MNSPSQKGHVWNCQINIYLVGGFNPSEKYSSKWESSPSRGENKKCLKPPPSYTKLYIFHLNRWEARCQQHGVKTLREWQLHPWLVRRTWLLRKVASFTLPETNSSPLKMGHPKRKLVFQPSIFRCYVSFRECKVSSFEGFVQRFFSLWKLDSTSSAGSKIHTFWKLDI